MERKLAYINPYPGRSTSACLRIYDEDWIIQRILFNELIEPDVARCDVVLSRASSPANTVLSRDCSTANQDTWIRTSLLYRNSKRSKQFSI